LGEKNEQAEKQSSREEDRDLQSNGMMGCQARGLGRSDGIAGAIVLETSTEVAEKHARLLQETVAHEREEAMRALLKQIRQERDDFARERDEQFRAMQEMVERERGDTRAAREVAEEERAAKRGGARGRVRQAARGCGRA
jgi:hypothetical protein